MSQAIQMGASQAMGPSPLCPKPSFNAGGNHNVHSSSQERTCGCKRHQAIGTSQGPGVRLLCRDAPGSESDQLSASCDSSDEWSASTGGAGAAGAVLGASALHARIRPRCSQLDMTAGACWAGLWCRQLDQMAAVVCSGTAAGSLPLHPGDCSSVVAGLLGRPPAAAGWPCLARH